MDSSGGSGVNVAEERRKLQEEKKALDNLMQVCFRRSWTETELKIFPEKCRHCGFFILGFKNLSD